MTDERNKRIEDLEESVCNLQQALATARGKVEHMAIALTREGQTKMATQAANEIEEAFAVGGMTRQRRFDSITKTIRRQIAIAVNGEAYWND